MTLHAISERYGRSVIPHIMINGAGRAIDFYKRAFGATDLFRILRPDGNIVHAEVGIGVNVDTLFNQAVELGAEVLQPLQNMFYGDRMGMLKDPFGHV